MLLPLLLLKLDLLLEAAAVDDVDLILVSDWMKLLLDVEVLALPCLVVETDLDDADEAKKLFFDSSPPTPPAEEGVLLGIIDLPGEELFLATGGGVFRLAGIGEDLVSFVEIDENLFSSDLL